MRSLRETRQDFWDWLQTGNPENRFSAAEGGDLHCNVIYEKLEKASNTLRFGAEETAALLRGNHALREDLENEQREYGIAVAIILDPEPANPSNLRQSIVVMTQDTTYQFTPQGDDSAAAVRDVLEDHTRDQVPGYFLFHTSNGNYKKLSQQAKGGVMGGYNSETMFPFDYLALCAQGIISKENVSDITPRPPRR